MSGSSLPPTSTPTPATPSGGQARAAVAVADVTIESLPPKLALLTRTVTVTGQVVAQEDGTATIRTPAGDVQVKTPVPLPTDRPVQLQIPGGQTAAQPQRAVASSPQPVATQPAPSGQSGAQAGAQAGAQPGGSAASQTVTSRPLPASGQPVPQPSVMPTTDGVVQPDGQTLPVLRPNIAIRATVLALPPVVIPPAPSPVAPSPVAPSPASPGGQGLPPIVSSGQPQALGQPAGTAGQPVPALPSSGAAAAVTGAVQRGTAALAGAPVTQPATAATAGAPAQPPLQATAPLPAAAAPPGNGTQPGSASSSTAGGTAGSTAGRPPLEGQPASPPPSDPDGGVAGDDLLRVPVPGRGPLRPGTAPPPVQTGATEGPAPSAKSAAPAAAGAAIPARIIAQASATEVRPIPGPAAPTASAAPMAAGPAAIVPQAAVQPGAMLPPMVQLAPGQSIQVRLVGPTAQAAQAGAPGTPPTPMPSDPFAPMDDAEAASGPGRILISGTVVGSTSAGQTIVTTPAGMLVLQARTSMPPGSPVQLAIDGPAATSTLAAAAIDILHGRDWPVLKDIMALLAASDPALAKQVANTAIPQANRRLTTNLVFLLSAIRGGDAGGWLGDATTAALDKAGRPDLLERMSQDMRAMARQAAEPLPDGWTVFPLPFGEPGRLERLQLYLRRGGDRDGDGGGGQRETRRFLIDIEFTRLGAMQMDGLVWPGHLDLILRTRDLLPQALRTEIGDIFRSSLDAVGFAGTLGFQTGAHAWVTVRRGGGQVSA